MTPTWLSKILDEDRIGFGSMKIERALDVVHNIKRRPLPRPFRHTRRYIAKRESVEKPWTWAGASYREKAEWVRAHHRPGAFGGRANFTNEQVCDLFNLTHHGLIAIARGEDWHPSFDRGYTP